MFQLITEAGNSIGTYADLFVFSDARRFHVQGLSLFVPSNIGKCEYLDIRRMVFHIVVLLRPNRCAAAGRSAHSIRDLFVGLAGDAFSKLKRAFNEAKLKQLRVEAEE